MIKAVAFDFGNTLIDSRFPLSWQESYNDVIKIILKRFGLQINIDRIRSGEDALLKYNTRVNPREHEVDSNTIFTDLLERWGINDSTKIRSTTDAFAELFLGKSVLYEDSVPTLKAIKKKGLQTGVLTNVAYGLGTEYMLRDADDEVSQYIDVFITSIEVGFRKPNPAGYIKLAKRLGISVADCMFVGDEEVDIIGANSSGMISVLLDRNNNDRQYGQVYTIKNLLDIIPLIQ